MRLRGLSLLVFAAGIAAGAPLGGCYDLDALTAGLDTDGGFLLDGGVDLARSDMLPTTCSNGVFNSETETDVDCGKSCGGCAVGRQCEMARDCLSLNCTNKRCAAGTCGDGVKNGLESDRDCGGGTCPKCVDGKACVANGDCTSNRCINRICMPSSLCGDGTKNGAETDVDCGGGGCPRCADGKTCQFNADCVSGSCVSARCTAGAGNCSDGLKNGDESDVDCGGAMCVRCPAGRACRAGADCSSGTCNGNICG